MQNKCFSVIAAMICSVTVSSAVHAQVAGTTQPVVRPFSIKIGGYFPTGSGARDLGEKTKLMIGLDDALGKSTSNSPTLGSVYFDFSGDLKSGDHVDTYGVGYSLRSFSSPAGSSSGPAGYIGAGLGVYYLDVKSSGTPAVVLQQDGLQAHQVLVNGNVNSFSSTKFTIGGKVFGGVETNHGLFLEASYQILPSVHGVNPSGIGVEIGQRF